MHYILLVLSLFLRNRGLWRPASIILHVMCDVMYANPTNWAGPESRTIISTDVLKRRNANNNR